MVWLADMFTDYLVSAFRRIQRRRFLKKRLLERTERLKKRRL